MELLGGLSEAEAEGNQPVFFALRQTQGGDEVPVTNSRYDRGGLSQLSDLLSHVEMGNW